MLVVEVYGRYVRWDAAGGGCQVEPAECGVESVPAKHWEYGGVGVVKVRDLRPPGRPGELIAAKPFGTL
ncbi:MAG: hypothetical protein ACLPUT_10860 [Solirubrobacteraceae bacterium]